MNSKEKVLELERIFNAVDHSVQQELDKRDSRIGELQNLLDEYKDSEHAAVKARGEAQAKVAELEAQLEASRAVSVAQLRDRKALEAKLDDWEAYAKKIEHDLRQRIAELEAERKADCLAFAQWFRSGNNRDGRTEDECWRVWSELQSALGDEE